MGRKKNDILQGTLALLVLKTLCREPIHGWGLSLRRILCRSRRYL